MIDGDSGFLNIRKPAGCTSYDVIRLLKRSLGIRTIGHSGTLDPFATGVLVVGLNAATRLFEYIAQDKVYIAKILCGTETDTNDITGEIIRSHKHVPNINEIKKQVENFKGKIKQKPPLFSSVKIQGKRSYLLARNGSISLDDMKEKVIEIFSSEVISIANNIIELKVHCSSGTYIRSLARDLGVSLGCGAVLLSLTRVKIGEYFTYESSIEPGKITKDNLSEYLIPPLRVIKLQKLYLTERQSWDLQHGRIIVTNKIQPPLNDKNELLAMLIDNKNKLMGIGIVTEDCIIKPKKIFTSGK